MKTNNRLEVAIVATHPIQYHIPWFQHLALEESISLKIYYAFIPGPEEQGIGFRIPFKWDIPVLEGYDWELLRNRFKKPSLNGFFSSILHNVFKVFERNRPNVAILTGWQAMPMLQALLACKRLGIPCLVRGDSNALKPRHSFVKQAHRILLSLYDGFLSVGKSNHKFYLQNGVKSEVIFDCPHIIDNKRFFNQALELRNMRGAIRRTWNIPEGAVCFVFVGKLAPKKRILDLLRAVRRVKKDKDNIFLLVVGTGELMESAHRFVKSNDLPVTFAGFLNQTKITKAYVVGDCLVLPSDYGETWGLVVNEAMACGLPAIVSDRVGCGPDLVEEGVTGAVFPFGGVGALAQRMVEMASDPHDARKMGQLAMERVLQHYSVERAVEGTLEAIEAVLGHRG